MLAAIVIVVGVLAHKASETFALMLSTHTAGLAARAQKIILALFAAMTPVGVAVGLLATHYLERKMKPPRPGLSGFSTRFAAGTFIYMAIVRND